LRAITSGGITGNNFRFDLTNLMPQVVPGHRLWVGGAAGSQSERFVSVERLEFRQSIESKQIWLRLYIFADDIRRINLGHQELLTRGRLDGHFGEVSWNETVNERALICLEQLNTVTYNHRPSDKVPALVASVRHLLWRTVLSTPPYRKYYIYPAPTAEHPQVLPQLLSIYAITYYLGSIVRYRPHHFDKILAGNFGPFIEAFLNDQPAQFIYLMASEFAEKEVTRAAIV
jgi:hypothetical protein